MSDRTLLEAEQRRLERDQQNDRVELAAIAAAPAAGSMADYERARRRVLMEDIAHREAQLRSLTERRSSSPR